jgi:galactofuranosylgalactofuranosylrhamnosyl-N-acetylglucosaminyl-diphospho-decaprenol beta-1,5/1,6-galactofuranosyltransferase
MTDPTTTAGDWRVLQRIVFPTEPDRDILPLYVEGRLSSPMTLRRGKKEADRILSSAAGQASSQALSRRRYRIKPRSRTSFGTYFNAFPAAYWWRWTVVESVRLAVTVSGTGAVLVYRSNARGINYRVDMRHFSAATNQTMDFDLPLVNFADGGWYWFDLVAGEDGAILENGQWETKTDRPQGTVTVGVTTLNRPDDVVALLGQCADPTLLPILDRVTVVDQGSQHPDQADGYAAAEAALGGRLRMIRQANLGGSGGFARGMLETLDHESSTYHLLSDDDVKVEPESILRAVAFADLARRPTIVGGHMFSMYDRAHLHSMGERVQLWRFWWESVLTQFPGGHHLGEVALRSAPELHRRVNVDYNGWWMELIPTEVIRRLGLSLPFFIKWDDAEYGLRARAAGVPTVSLPGVAVWHVPWTDKDDSIDWQAYYHQRNRMVAALIHSPFKFGGRLVRESLYLQVKHLLSAQYSVSELRNQAIEDILIGPDHLHRQLADRLPQIRRTRAQYDDARMSKDPESFPIVRRHKTSKRGSGFQMPTSRAGIVVRGTLGAVKALLPVKRLSRRHPEAEIAAMDAKWWMLSAFDSAIVSSSDGSGMAWYKRQPEEFRHQAERSLALHQRLLREWPRLSQEYRAAAADLTAPETWRSTFEVANLGIEQPAATTEAAQ